MSTTRNIGLQIDRAEQWWRACIVMRQAAETRLRQGGEHHEIAGKRRELEVAEAKCRAAYEDLAGWRSFQKRYAGRLR